MTRPFDHILTVMMENQYRSYVIQDAFMRKLARAGLNLTNSFGCFHPSQTNYLAALTGEICQITNDTAPTAALPQRSVTDQLTEAGLSWRAYMEGFSNEPWNPVWGQDSYPADQAPLAEAPNAPGLLARYFRKHNAFASLRSVQSDAESWGRIGDENAFWADVTEGTLPSYSWFSPDIWNDGHYLYNTHLETQPRTHLVPQLSAWLEHVFFGNLSADMMQGAQGQVGLNLDIDLLLSDPKAAWKACRLPPRTLVVVTFDEADYNAVGYDTNYDGPNQIYTVLLGDMITPGTTWDAPVNHYALLRTVQENFGLGSLGKNDQGAGYIRALWGQRFAWSAPQVGVWDDAERLVAAQCQGRACAVMTKGAEVSITRLTDGDWSTPAPVPFEADGPILASGFDDGMLVWTGSALYLTKDGNDWDRLPAPQGPMQNPCLAGYRETDGSPKAMACGQDPHGWIHFQIFDGTTWSAPSPVGQISDGPMALGQIGASLLLVYKERNTKNMRCINYALAEFNAIKALNFKDTPAPQNDTGVQVWAVADFRVGHFARKFASVADAYQAQGQMALAAIDGELHLIHRGAYADTPQAYEAVFGLTGLMAPLHQQTNGYGSLEQAGWTEEAQLLDVTLVTDGALGLCPDGEDLVMVWRDAAGPRWCRGGYQPAE